MPAEWKYNGRLALILLAVAAGIASAVNIAAPYLSYEACDQLIVGAAIVFLVAAVPICFLPAWCIASLWALAAGGWALGLRFTEDISGALLLVAMLVFTVLLTIKTMECTRELAADRDREDSQQNSQTPPE